MIGTLYAACIARLGLSQALAAELHKVSLQSVKNWCSGRSEPPAGVWDDLRALEANVIDLSEELREAWDDGERDGPLYEQAVQSHAGLMALADLALTLDEAPPKLLH